MIEDVVLVDEAGAARGSARRTMEQGAGPGMKPSELAIRAALDSIHDPCSISVGAPLGLIEMGLVTGIEIGDDGKVTVDIRLTSAGCMMGILYFDKEIKRRLDDVSGVTAVAVGRTHDLTWSEEDISLDGRARLRDARLKRLPVLPAPVAKPSTVYQASARLHIRTSGETKT